MDSDTENHKLYKVVYRVTEKSFFGTRERVVESQIVADSIEVDRPFTSLFLVDNGKKHLSGAFRTEDVISIVAKAIVERNTVSMSARMSKAEKNRLEQTIARSLKELGFSRDEEGHFIKEISVPDRENKESDGE